MGGWGRGWFLQLCLCETQYILGRNRHATSCQPFLLGQYSERVLLRLGCLRPLPSAKATALERGRRSLKPMPLKDDLGGLQGSEEKVSMVGRFRNGWTRNVPGDPRTDGEESFWKRLMLSSVHCGANLHLPERENLDQRGGLMGRDKTVWSPAGLLGGLCGPQVVSWEDCVVPTGPLRGLH